MTKSLVNKIRLKERLYTFFMAESTPFQNYLDKFNSILIDVDSIDVKIDNENKAMYSVDSLTALFM